MRWANGRIGTISPLKNPLRPWMLRVEKIGPGKRQRACFKFRTREEAEAYSEALFRGDVAMPKKRAANAYGVVYFVRASPSGNIKIGFAADCRVRIETLQIGTWESLELLAAIPSARKHERVLHGMFARDRIRGEWFRPSAELLTFVETVKAKENLSALLAAETRRAAARQRIAEERGKAAARQSELLAAREQQARDQARVKAQRARDRRRANDRCSSCGVNPPREGVRICERCTNHRKQVRATAFTLRDV